MTWTKLSDAFGDECASLSDAAFRTHVEALLWIMRRETGGVISDRDVLRFAETENPDEAIAELIACGFWTRSTRRTRGVTYHVMHHMEHQDDPELTRVRREKAAERSRNWRRKRAGLDGERVTERITDTDTESVTSRAGSGLVGSGLEQATPVQADPGPTPSAPGTAMYPNPRQRATPDEYVNGANAVRAAIQRKAGDSRE